MSMLVALRPGQPSRSPPLRLALLAAAAAFLFDWATKSWALDTVHNVAMPLGNLTLGVARNDGFAFSSGEGHFSPATIAAARVLILTAVLYTFRGLVRSSRRSAVGLALVTAGGSGNAADVILRDGAVIDFIAAGPFVFNLADIAILIGVALLAPVIQSWGIDVQQRMAERLRARVRRVYRTTADQLR